MATPGSHILTRGWGTRPPEATTVAAICSNWLTGFEQTAGPGPGAFFNFRNSAAGGQHLGRPGGLSFLRGGWGGAGVCPGGSDGVQGAGGRGTTTGWRSPGTPPDGHQWVPAPWVPPHTNRGGWGGCRHEHPRCRLWGVGAAFWCPKWPVPLSRLFRGGLKSHRNPLKSVGMASGWCEIGHHHVCVGQVCERISAQTPWIHPEPKIPV
jgi:hypothetical protein